MMLGQESRNSRKKTLVKNTTILDLIKVHSNLNKAKRTTLHQPEAPPQTHCSPNRPLQRPRVLTWTQIATTFRPAMPSCKPHWLQTSKNSAMCPLEAPVQTKKAPKGMVWQAISPSSDGFSQKSSEEEDQFNHADIHMHEWIILKDRKDRQKERQREIGSMNETNWLIVLCRQTEQEYKRIFVTYLIYFLIQRKIDI